MFDNSYDFEDVRIDDVPVTDATVKTGGWNVDNGRLTPVANRWNYILMGDSTAHDYTFSMRVRRTKGSGQIQLRVRDNGKDGDACDYIAMAINPGSCEFYRQSGAVRDTLRSPRSYSFESNRWYDLKIVCNDETISCYVDNEQVHQVELPPLPSLVSVATLDKENNTILLKVVNTTQHEEKTALDVLGVNVRNDAEVIQLTGEPLGRNTFAEPEKVVPLQKSITFSLGGPMVYSFPPNSITIMKLQID